MNLLLVFILIFDSTKSQIVDVGLKPHVKTEITLMELHDSQLIKSSTNSINGFGFKGLGEDFDIGVDQDSGGGIMIGSSIDRNSDKKITENYARCSLRLFSCKKTKARANVYFQKFEDGNDDVFEMQPLIVDEVTEQCDPKLHDGCFVSIDIEEYAFNYTLGPDVALKGKAIALVMEKGCTTFDTFMPENNASMSDSIPITYRDKKYAKKPESGAEKGEKSEIQKGSRSGFP